jgi:hypothetical protein
VKIAAEMAKDTPKSAPHPSLMRRMGDAAETALLVSAFAAIWGSVGVIVVAAIIG